MIADTKTPALPPISPFDTISPSPYPQRDDTNGPLSHALPPLPHDDVLQAHYVRVQQTLIDSVDQKMGQMDSAMREREHALKKLEDEKVTMGVALYQTKTGLARANDSLLNVRNQLREREDEVTLLFREKSTTEKEISNVLSANKTLQSELEIARKQVAEGLEKIKQLQDINTAYTSELKIQKRIHSKLKKELEVNDEKRRVSEAEAELRKTKLDSAAREGKDLELKLENQRSEVIVAQKAIDKMHAEIKQLEGQKDAIEKQWNEAISAMSKRDKTVQIMEDSKQKTLNQNVALQNEIRALKQERDEMSKNLADKELETQRLCTALEKLNALHKKVTEDYLEAKNRVEESRMAENGYKKELGYIKKQNDTLSNELDQKMSDITTMKSRLQTMKRTFDEQMKKQIPKEEALKKEEQVKNQAEREFRTLAAQEESKSINMRKVNANLQLKLQELEEQYLHVSQEKVNLQLEHKQVSDHYSKLYEEAKHLIYALERREHDLNYLKAKVAQKEADNTGTFNMIIGKLRHDLQQARIETDRVQQLWLESQKTALKAKERSTKLEQENAILETRLGITDGVKSKTNGELTDAQTEAFENKLEAAKLYSELRRMQPVIDELKKKNMLLEQQLTEARLKLEESRTNQTTSTHMLRAEIRRLYDDKSELVKEKKENARQTTNIERKTELYKEMIDKLKAERYELQRTNFTLKKKVDDLEKRYFDAKMQARQSAEKSKAGSRQSSHSSESSHRSINMGNQSGSQSLAQSFANLVETNDQLGPPPTAPSQVPTSVQTPQPVRDIPDFESWRLKIESLTTERNFLMNENESLKNRLNEAMAKVSTLENQLKETKHVNRDLEKSLADSKHQVVVLEAKYDRAEKVAAHLEHQIKDLKPNVKIDYQLVGDYEPSTQLLACLFVTESNIKVKYQGKHTADPTGGSIPPTPNRRSISKRNEAKQPLSQ